MKLATSTRAWEHLDLPYIKASFSPSPVASPSPSKRPHGQHPAGIEHILCLSGTRLDILYALLQAVSGVEQDAAPLPLPPQLQHQHHLDFVHHQQQVEHITESITRIYESELRHSPALDRWMSTSPSPSSSPRGRALFKSTVARSVRRRAAVSFVLPAFPCKTSNLEKVSGTLPDKGEELALRTILTFLDKVDAVYEHGAVFHIVSDGHVFSDLIGVGDSTVDAYSLALRHMAAHLEAHTSSRPRSVDGQQPRPRIVFHGLAELLRPHPLLFACLGIDASDEASALQRISASLAENTTNPPQMMPAFSSSSSAGSPNPESFGTRLALCGDIRYEVELQRAVLNGVFGCRRLDNLEFFISQDVHTLALYRGFARFLLEDIGNHLGLLALGVKSVKQRKRLCERMAKVMIQRNDAYSRLVQIRFPDAVRLSIHPHDNSGPKFAVCLMHARYRLSDIHSDTSILHIPTPWHNVVLQIPPTDEHTTQHAAEGPYATVKRRDVGLYCPSSAHQLRYEPWSSQTAKGSGGYFYFQSSDQ
ncbi:hypothetical protein OC845_005006 [Tilletia horrida]|nr:hypothetical protein OC845_005006 [Tilletia horrida]